MVEDMGDKGEVLSPTDVQRAALDRKLSEERASASLRETKKWNAMFHVLVLFAAFAAIGVGVVYLASVFGVTETGVGVAFVMAASIAAYVYIQNA